jgi:hypothetical protein
MTWYNFLKSMFGTKTADRLTNYKYWTIPMAENIDPPRVRDRVSPDGRINWEPEVVDLYVDFRGRPMSDGVMTGNAAQLGASTFRSLTWGWAIWGQIGALDPKYKTKIPLPKRGWYWITGHPVPSYDKGCIITEPHPTQKIIHELVQFDPSQPENAISNQALAWGKWVDGELVAGESSSATGGSISTYLWTPWSKENPHRISIVVWDYIGADGTYVDKGVEAGRLIMLDPNSESYKNMVALGGECAAIAKAAAEFGVLVADRRVGVTTPQGGSFRIQPGGQWQSTNLSQLKIKHSDFIYAK